MKKKKKLLPLNKLRDKAWDRVSSYIRRKDADKNGIVKCYTCGNPHMWTDMQGAHFFHGVGKKTYLMEENVKPCCVSCNKWRSGNLAIYAANLLDEDPEIIPRLFMYYGEPFNPTRAYYEEIILKYKEKP
jgi:hypothetical protein